MRESAPAGDLGLDIVVVVEGGGGEAGRGYIGGEADVAGPIRGHQQCHQTKLTNHSSPAQLQNLEVIFKRSPTEAAIVRVVDTLPDTHDLFSVFHMNSFVVITHHHLEYSRPELAIFFLVFFLKYYFTLEYHRRPLEFHLGVVEC